MIPFGRCLNLWRLHRGMSQAVLAREAGVPQPNLSDMERGEKEVSLRTLRALALALNIKPGLLADGIGPDSQAPLVLTRDRLERIAQAVVEGKTMADAQERELAMGVTLLVKAKFRAMGHSLKRPSKIKVSRVIEKWKNKKAWLLLKTKYRDEEIDSLIKRISEKIRSKL